MLWFRSRLRRTRSKSPMTTRPSSCRLPPSGKLMINQDDTTWDQLGPRLEDIFKQRADKVAFVKGDDYVDFGEVAQAIDIMRGSGIDQVGLITAKIEAGQ